MGAARQEAARLRRSWRRVRPGSGCGAARAARGPCRPGSRRAAADCPDAAVPPPARRAPPRAARLRRVPGGSWPGRRPPAARPRAVGRRSGGGRPRHGPRGGPGRRWSARRGGGHWWGGHGRPDRRTARRRAGRPGSDARQRPDPHPRPLRVPGQHEDPPRAEFEPVGEGAAVGLGPPLVERDDLPEPVTVAEGTQGDGVEVLPLPVDRRPDDVVPAGLGRRRSCRRGRGEEEQPHRQQHRRQGSTHHHHRPPDSPVHRHPRGVPGSLLRSYARTVQRTLRRPDRTDERLPRPCVDGGQPGPRIIPKLATQPGEHTHPIRLRHRPKPLPTLATPRPGQPTPHRATHPAARIHRRRRRRTHAVDGKRLRALTPDRLRLRIPRFSPPGSTGLLKTAAARCRRGPSRDPG